ncbi:MAG: hypothetical protein KGS61_00040 [Verrucomicrobia bacterium]|nr:hypothetical protein [Verrucomicrobiota bacterium]
MEDELKTVPPPAAGESSMSEPGPCGLGLFAIGFVGFLLSAAGVITASVPLLGVGLLLAVGSLSCFILCGKATR